eukprot:11209498-Alexandrium_andersonii.AAC.1
MAMSAIARPNNTMSVWCIRPRGLHELRCAVGTPAARAYHANGARRVDDNMSYTRNCTASWHVIASAARKHELRPNLPCTTTCMVPLNPRRYDVHPSLAASMVRTHTHTQYANRE